MTAPKQLSDSQRARLDAQLDKWRDELVNLTRRNKLIYFKHTKASTLEIVAPSAGSIHAALQRGSWSFFLPPPTDDGDEQPARRPAPTELVTDKKLASDVEKALKALDRVSRQTEMDTGLWVLYLCFGMLHWSDADGQQSQSPLLLVPVQLVRPAASSPYLLSLAEGDALVNPALLLKLSADFGIDLPSLEQTDADPTAIADATRDAIARRDGWYVTDRVILSTFTFHKEAMYRDLLENAEAVADHHLVRLLGLGAEVWDDALTVATPDEAELDQVAPPEQLHSVRNADATQRVCIIAARDGDSFVMDGPPGTGKSQTITNIITELLSVGKTVLFVSEKAAALDVVHKRLSEAQLDEFVLELHSHKATRREVAATLGRSLDLRPSATTAFDDSNRAALQRDRNSLNGYALAMNELRSPLRRSVHQVLGRIAQLQNHPRGPVAKLSGARLTPDEYTTCLEAGAQLASAWGPVQRGDGFLWREVRDAELSGSRRQRLEAQLGDCREDIDGLRDTLRELDEALGLGTSVNLRDASRVQALLEAVEAHPARSDLPEGWLTGAIDLAEAEARASVLGELAAQHRQATWTASQIAGPAWSTVSTASLDELEAAIGALGALRPPVNLGVDDPGHVDGLLGAIAAASTVSKRIIAAAEAISRSFGLALPAVTADRARELAELAGLVGAPTPPEANWLDPVVQGLLDEAHSVLSSLIADYRGRREQLKPVFRDNVIEIDVRGLHARLQAARGLKRLGGTYRADKKLLATTTVTGAADAEAIRQLDQAISWQEVSERLRQAETVHAPVLGTYYRGPLDTDLDRILRARELTRRALELVRGGDTAQLAKQLARGGQPDTHLLAAAKDLKSALSEWHDQQLPRLRELANPVEDPDLRQFDDWSARSSAVLQRIRHLVGDASATVGRALSVPHARRLLAAVRSANEIAGAFASAAERDTQMLGPSYKLLGTPFGDVVRDLRWARSVLTAATGPFHESAATYLLAMPPLALELSDQIRRVVKGWAEVGDLFESHWRDRLNEDFSVSLADGSALVDELRSSIGDIGEWQRYSSARAALVDLGLLPCIEFLEHSRTPSTGVAGVLERSLLEQWVDAVFSSDPRLHPYVPAERNRLVERFRELDRRQVANAAAQVINRCTARRPQSTAGVSAIIRREAMKKTRHMPVRTLIDQAREVVLALKPCFMMSPLTVSQFLPADLRFDVVIFDEASQVKPSDAINCVYRGNQLIVAGDPKQLPPTGFFDRLTDDGTDEYDADEPDSFESVLDVCRGSGLPLRSLRWHYRSQHEDLITYSNYKFYDGRLHTFPGAQEKSDDIGIEFFHVPGTYRRGGSRDNPMEAAAVVDRVLHHQRENPHLTLGVVAFSTNQQAAIEAELDRRTLEDPSLPALLSDDRLDGFFVKNLENVQGDERDLIIFSIGYGRDENGKFTENLGPLTSKGGERRLNVAITRARRRVEVVASVRGADFPGTSASEGVRHLQRYLEFAEQGISALALDVSTTSSDAESPFEEEVIRVVRQLGFDAVPQVGVAGFRIDIGVRHPGRPGEYVLGIECDGAAYHSSKVARDRDRLRQEILEGLGWRLHRIWGPAWYHDRPGQTNELRQAIHEAVEPGRRKAARPPAPAEPPRPVVETVVVDMEQRPAWARDYVVSHFTPRLHVEFHEPRNRAEIERAIAHIVQHEGPIHDDLLRQRINESFGIGRTGSRVKSAVDAALATARSSKLVVHDNGVYRPFGARPITVRVPTDDPATQRAVGQIPPEERQAAIAALAKDALRIAKADLGVAFARLFGWRRAGADIQGAFDADVRALLADRRIQIDGDGNVRPVTG